jgi:hypothetical protein
MTGAAEPRFWRTMAGLFAGPFAWAVHQQGNYMLVPVSCHTGTMFLPAVTLASVAIALIGGWLSLTAWRGFGRANALDNAATENRHFLAGLSMLMSALFLFAILMQGAATLVLGSCQR